MGYYGQSAYRGDYLRGRGNGGVMRPRSFHPVLLGRGDFLTDLGGVLGKVGGYIDKGLEYAPIIGTVVKGATAAFKATAPAVPSHPALQSPQVGGGGLPALPALPARGGAIQMVKQRGYKGGTAAPKGTAALHGGGGHRRMNVLNPKALRRSLRRAAGFLKVAKHFVKILKPGHAVHLKEHHHKHKR